MAKIVGKQTLLMIALTGGTLATIAQVYDIKAGMQASETVECDDHDNADAGIPKGATGRSSQEDITFDFYFSTHAMHKLLAACVRTPLPGAGKLPLDGELVRSDAVAADFTAAGVGFGTSYPINDYVKANGKLVISKLINYPVA